MIQHHQAKPGVDINLEHRQIFLLFMASAMVLSLVFALGVVVGKGIENRPAVVPAVDPLALIDQVGYQDGIEEKLTFHETLVGKKAKAQVKHAPTAIKKSAAEQLPAPLHALPESPSSAAAATTKTTPLAAGVLRSPKKAVSGNAGEKIAAANGDATTAKSKPSPTENKAPTGGSYTLQLSSFQDQQEAELFMKKLRSAGMKPFMVPAQIPGRGIWFRVRIGTYHSWEDAVAAKQRFEHDQKIIAYVARLTSETP